MITPVVAAKIWYLKNVWFLLGHPVILTTLSNRLAAHELHEMWKYFYTDYSIEKLRH